MPLGHGAEEVAGAIGVGLDGAPFGVVAEGEGAEVVYCFADVVAGADEE